MNGMKKFYSAIILCFFYSTALAQLNITSLDIPQMRQIFHDNIDKLQLQVLQLPDGNGKLFNATDNIDLNLQYTNSIVKTVDNLQYAIETNTEFSDNEKYKWLRSIADMLNYYSISYRQKNIAATQISEYINTYKACMQLELKHKPITAAIEKADLEVIKLLLINDAFFTNIGIANCKDILVYKTCVKYPDNILNIVDQNLNFSKADSFLTIAAYKNPERFYNYAASENKLSQKIRTIKEPFVSTISKMAAMPSGRFYFPFLDEIYRGRLTIDSIETISKNEDAYYKLLVNTQVQYANRLQQTDTPYVMHVLTKKLQEKAVDVYINEINALHDEKSEAVRFKITDSLTAKELYYLCVLGEEEMYTSSYLGIYKRIFERLVPPRADSLLGILHYDFYKKFIRMAAAYNKLDDFLTRMERPAAEHLMQLFVDGLDKTNTLEDAVDVADSYASISDTSLKKIMIDRVYANFQTSKQQQNKRATIIYEILYSIFTAKENNTSNLLANTPVYTMPAKLLKDTVGKIIMLQFFYGDKDGVNVFNGFLNTFSNANWKRIQKPDWVEVTSTKGIPITIYANKPLDELKDLDAQAQEHLLNYLDSLNIQPTVVIHRGHSYYVKQTIAQLPPSAKVILLGSCGGYHSLNEVLKTCPTAHIIASKQVGTGVVNITLIDAITETLRLGKDLNWSLIWKQLETRFTKDMKDKFDDYVPPHKNLGAVFIMAYNQQMMAH
jgi:hypothetical protein